MNILHTIERCSSTDTRRGIERPGATHLPFLVLAGCCGSSSSPLVAALTAHMQNQLMFLHMFWRHTPICVWDKQLFYPYTCVGEEHFASVMHNLTSLHMHLFIFIPLSFLRVAALYDYTAYFDCLWLDSFKKSEDIHCKYYSWVSVLLCVLCFVDDLVTLDDLLFC